MELARTILLHLTYLTFLGSVAGRMEISPNNIKKRSLIGIHRTRRDLTTDTETSAQLTDANLGSLFIRSEDVKEPSIPSASGGAHIRVKRYRHSLNHFHNLQSMRVGCRFGTCTVQNLAHQIYQYTDRDKDSTAPAKKISSLGYGRRRRSLPDRKLLLTLVDGKIRPSWVNANERSSDPSSDLPEHVPALGQTSRPNHEQGTWKKSKLWETLLKT
ncbi:pro-adrenomedullin [Spea bombifrons]|uniref:pro-adrenomedullin n=1 Tax=Spea bombifrons TaxID=233779 RepID=UPI00234A11A5|nr:pro-adrenomedullin [Spea bombifrons]XP_053305606.1 pro-adrenomedullin [Spea bombifrons]